MNLSIHSIKYRVVAALFLFLASVSQAWAITPFEEFDGAKQQVSPVQIKSMISPAKTQPGGKFKLHVHVSVDPGWHIYSINPKEEDKLLATTLHLRSNPFLPVGEWKESKPIITLDEALQKMLKTHESMADFVHEFQVPETVGQDSFLLRGEIIYRVCDNLVCSLPRKLPFSSTIQIAQ